MNKEVEKALEEMHQKNLELGKQIDETFDALNNAIDLLVVATQTQGEIIESSVGIKNVISEVKYYSKKGSDKVDKKGGSTGIGEKKLRENLSLNK